jgi:hypothetical protein
MCKYRVDHLVSNCHSFWEHMSEVLLSFLKLCFVVLEITVAHNFAPCLALVDLMNNNK